MNNTGLYKELRAEIDKDKMYWVRNDAKCRAAVTSKNYDEFREIVAAAHLQPLSKAELNKKRPAGWNKAVQ